MSSRVINFSKIQNNLVGYMNNQLSWIRLDNSEQSTFLDKDLFHIFKRSLKNKGHLICN